MESQTTGNWTVCWEDFSDQPQNNTKSIHHWPFVRRIYRQPIVPLTKGHYCRKHFLVIMMTSSNGNIFRVTGPLYAEFTGHWWSLLTKASDAQFWCFLWSEPEEIVEYTIETSVIWDAIALIMTSLQWWRCRPISRRSAVLLLYMATKSATCLLGSHKHDKNRCLWRHWPHMCDADELCKK